MWKKKYDLQFLHFSYFSLSSNVSSKFFSIKYRNFLAFSHNVTISKPNANKFLVSRQNSPRQNSPRQNSPKLQNIPRQNSPRQNSPKKPDKTVPDKIVPNKMYPMPLYPMYFEMFVQ